MQIHEAYFACPGHLRCVSAVCVEKELLFAVTELLLQGSFDENS